MDRLHPYGRLQRKWRTARMRSFVDAFGITNETRILDVGGDLWNWTLVDVRPRLTILNVVAPPEPLPDGVEWVVADACDLPFADHAFDVVYSNSLIEHLCNRMNQERFSREVRRVGRRYYVQTPNRWFPVEPHLLSPFIHYLPRSWQRPLYPYTVWGMLYRPSQAVMDANFEQISLLTRADLAALFQGDHIETERVAVLAKSFMVYGMGGAAAPPGGPQDGGH